MSYETPSHPRESLTPLPASPRLRRFTVVPRLPPALERVRELAHNLFWVWTPVARELLVRIDPALFEEVHGNPIELLARVKQARLDELAQDDAFLTHLDTAHAALRSYLGARGWFQRTFPEQTSTRIAYFSMEYGLHESLPIYSGGLGILAGDHLKSASDLGLPLVGVGLAYGEGYFRQKLDESGWQAERYPRNDWHKLPVSPVDGADRRRLVVHVQLADRVIHAQIWRVQVGRVPLFLLDTNVEENTPLDRKLTASLYGGDEELRIRQEILLGIGGVHALEAMGLSPTVCHMNEGHSAFLALERIARFMRERGATFEVASEATSAGNVFTTHTPVPAGNDAFDPQLVCRYLEPYRAALGISEEELLDLGRARPADPRAPFSMPVLAIRTADRCNGVSELHGHVSRRMWKDLWPDLPEHEVPITSVTNGVHIPSWISAEMSALYTRYLGPRWAESTDDPAIWARVQEIPDAELWQVHEHRRHRLVTLARKWVGSDDVLDPRALTIGFARRFATYKRANLLFTDLERVLRLLGDTDRPVQLVFAGKAHPQDKGGKELIRDIVQASRQAGLRGRVVFLEDYQMRIARALVSGVDVWLNTPRRPHEASGTSGMKAAANGGLNVSVLDGWWAEAWAKHGAQVGWAVGRGEEYEDDAGDRIEAELLYDVLERQVVPMFFERDRASGLPREWISRMKASIAGLVPSFNTARMVKEYTQHHYVPAIARAAELTADDLSAAKELVQWKRRVRAAWPSVAVVDVDLSRRARAEVRVGDAIEVEARVRLGDLGPYDVAVELYYGPTQGAHDLERGSLERMRVASANADGTHTFVGAIPTHESGSHAYSARVMPWNAALGHPYETSLVRWA